MRLAQGAGARVTFSSLIAPSRDEALAYFEPKREPELPALPEKIEEIDVDELLAE